MVGIIRQSAARPADGDDLEILFDDVSSTADILEAVTALVALLQVRVHTLPGIVGGLRLDPDAALVYRPEQLRDLVAARLLEAATALRPIARQLRAAEGELAGLFIEHPHL